MPARTRLAGAALAAALLAGPLPSPAPAAAPAVSAPAAILIQPATADIVYARRADDRRSIASTTKLMTALLTLERRRLSDRITAVPYPAAAVESVAGLRAGERLTTADMLRALMLASANDAAAAIAVDVGGSRRGFVRMMNERARRAGLRDTRFANPIGLDDPGNYSSPADLAKIALLVRADPFARRVMDRPSAVLRSGARVRTVRNRNTLVGAVPWVSGVKTGHTRRAGYVLVGSASRDGVELISVVMGAGSEGARNADTLALMNYGFSRYHRTAPVLSTTRRRLLPGRAAASVPIKHGDEDAAVAVVPAREVRVVARRGERVVATPTGLPKEIEGPVPARERVGTLVVRRRGKVVDRVPLVTARAVAQASWWDKNRWITGAPGLLIGICAGAVLIASLSRARGRRQVRERPGARSEIA
jgi:D-alanyl-D-alanine carboxypeptidase (penicillin-binding protein 5/6)